MAASDKNVSPEERLLNVIRGKDGQDSKASKDTKVSQAPASQAPASQAASASVDEEAPPLDEGPPPSVTPPAPVVSAPARASAPASIPAPAPAAPATKPAAPSASPKVEAAPSSAPAPSTAPVSAATEPQTTGPRTRGPLGDEKLKAALSRKVSERTRGDDKSTASGLPRGMGGAAAAIARAATQESFASPSSRGTTVAPVAGEATRFIAKKIQGDSAPGIRYVSMSFAAIILVVLMFSAYEIVAAINLEPISPPPRDEGTELVDVEDPLEPILQYQLVPLQEEFKHKSLFGQLQVKGPDGVEPMIGGTPPWVDELEKNFLVSGRLGDPMKGGELILRDKRDNKQYFIGLDSGIGVAQTTIYLKALEGNRAIFHDKKGSHDAELTW